MALVEKNHCYKSPCISYINMACDPEKSTVVLWTSNYLYIYNKANFDQGPIINTTNFEIKKVLIHNLHLVCLDSSGYLRKKNINSPDWLCDSKKIFTCERINKEYIVSLQYDFTEAAKLYINKFLNFDLQSEFQLHSTDKNWAPKERGKREKEGGKSLIASENIQPKYLIPMKQIFDIQNCESQLSLLVITLDKINVYGCLIDLNLDNNVSQNQIVKVVKLHESCSEIVGIKITVEDEICVLLGLDSGNIIKLPLINGSRNMQVFHLNAPLYKFSIIDNTVIYTDGLTMWKTENLFTKSNSIETVSKKFIVRNVRDFCIIGNRLICITFSHLIYSLLIDLSMSYVQSSNENLCPVQIVTNSHCLHKIKQAVQKNEEIIKKIDKEKTYVTALSLSQRPDLMEGLIQLTVNVYDQFETLKEKNIELSLTDEPSDYNDIQSYFFLLRFSVANIQHKLNKSLSDMLGNTNIHTTIIAHKVIKTTSIQLKRQLKKQNFVISLKRNQIKSSQIEVHVKIIANIPGIFNTNRSQWIILYQKCIVLHVSNFIITPSCSNSICLKEADDSLDEFSFENAEHLYGTLYKFSRSKCQFTACVMIPPHNINVLNNKLLYKNCWDVEKISKLLKPNWMGQIYTSENGFEFRIGDDKVVLSLTKITDSQSAMQIQSPNIYWTSEIRKMFSDLIYSHYKGDDDREESVSCDLLDTIENQRTQIKEFVTYGILNDFNREFYTTVYETILLEPIENEATQKELFTYRILNETNKEFYTTVHETIFRSLPI